MDIKPIFTTRLRATMENRKVSAKELAKAIGGEASTISNYRTDATSALPGAEKLVRIAKALDVSTDWLLGLSDEVKMAAPTEEDLELGYQKKWNRIKKYCPLGMEYFCDGSINPSRTKAGTKPKKPCVYYICRRCTNPKIKKGADAE